MRPPSSARTSIVMGKVEIRDYSKVVLKKADSPPI
jgi:hypothetical protein